MEQELIKISKYLSFILRHKPDEIGLNLDSQGWASIDDLLSKSTIAGLTRDSLQLVVETNDKQRFSISSDSKRIRAIQGHSISVDLELSAIEPPEILLHGTASRFIDSINVQGLIKGQRHHVHLSESNSVAEAVGSRYGKLVLLKIKAKEMHDAGYKFYRSTNNVWLTDHVPVDYIEEI